MTFVERLQRACEAVAEVGVVAGASRVAGVSGVTGVSGMAGASGGAELAGGGSGAGDVGRILAAEVPELLAALARDRADSAFSRWGLSTVIDENLRQPVIGRPLFEFLHEAAGVAATWPIGNAGVLHVYGYLLSTVSTPYGLKRERWLGTDLSTALGMPVGVFVDTLTIRGDVVGVGVTDVGLAGFVADRVLARMDTDTTTVDEFVGEESDEVFRAAYLASDDQAGSARGGAVAYWALLGDAHRLVTAFPVAVGAEEWLAAFTAEPPRLRYNAAAHELSPRAPLAGRRVFRAVSLPSS